MFTRFQAFPHPRPGEALCQGNGAAQPDPCSAFAAPLPWGHAPALPFPQGEGSKRRHATPLPQGEGQGRGLRENN